MPKPAQAATVDAPSASVRRTARFGHNTAEAFPTGGEALPVKSATKVRSRRVAVSEDKIMDVATQMFSERGYPAISIRDIAAECKVNIPSIYHYFEDKDDLYDRCCERAFQNIAEMLRVSLTSTGTTHERIKKFAVALSDVLLNNEQFRKLLQRELLLSQSKLFRGLVVNHFANEYRLLTAAVADVEGAAGAPAKAFSIYAMLFGLVALQPTVRISGAKLALHTEPKKLAEYVLTALFPKHAWQKH